MKITDIEVISFRLTSNSHPSRWGYGVVGKEYDMEQRIMKIMTDEGVEGYSTGPQGYSYCASRAEVERTVKPLLLGENPLDRERIWQWMMKHKGISEGLQGCVDSALWDLLGRMVGLPVSKLLGGAREKVKAYASTAPNLGSPELYANYAVECQQRGYQAYKIHSYIYWNPHTEQPAPGLPAFPKEDVAVCKAVREAVGDDMTLMLDPWGIYTYEESLYVGRELEKLNFYWLEHPMDERRLEPYRRLCRELDINICGPEHATGSYYSRAEWALQRATDIGRIDINYGGITGCKKAVAMYEGFGIPCEIHVGGFANSQILGTTTNELCEFFERGLLTPGVNYDDTPPYLLHPCDPMDAEGYVHLPQAPGLGMEFNWDYINDNLVDE